MVMPFEKFERILDEIASYSNRIHRIDEFFEKEITTESWCMFTVGDNLQQTLIRFLADEMNCWYCIRPDHEHANKEWYEVEGPYYAKENEIEDWLYNWDDGEPKVVTVDKVDYNITSKRDFYNYLIKFYSKEEIDNEE